jgi:hypothetical protein
MFNLKSTKQPILTEKHLRPYANCGQSVFYSDLSQEVSPCAARSSKRACSLCLRRNFLWFHEVEQGNRGNKDAIEK